MEEPIKIDKWNFCILRKSEFGVDNSYLDVIFRLNKDVRGIDGISKENIEELEKDLKDLGKWRKFKELKKDLESKNE